MQSPDRIHRFAEKGSRHIRRRHLDDLDLIKRNPMFLQRFDHQQLLVGKTIGHREPSVPVPNSLSQKIASCRRSRPNTNAEIHRLSPLCLVLTSGAQSATKYQLPRHAQNPLPFFYPHPDR